MIAKGGAPLLQEEAVAALKEELLPLALVITPNIPEAEALTGTAIRTMDDRREAARRLHRMGARYVVIKGGHDDDGEETVDLLYNGDGFSYFKSKRIDTRHTHGTGCTFAAAIAAELAKGRHPADAVATAKAFVQSAIAHPLGIGQGHGPTNHWAYRQYGE